MVRPYRKSKHNAYAYQPNSTVKLTPKAALFVLSVLRTTAQLTSALNVPLGANVACREGAASSALIFRYSRSSFLVGNMET